MSTSPIVHLVNREAVKEQARQIFDGLEKATGKVPKWVQVMANNEDILVGFFMMFKATMDDAPLPSILKWKVARVVSELNSCAFCVDVADMHLKQFNLTDEDIGKIEEQASEREKIAIEFAKDATKEAYKIPPEVVEKTKQHFNDEELVELAAVVGLFNYINRFNDALGVLPD